MKCHAHLKPCPIFKAIDVTKYSMAVLLTTILLSLLSGILHTKDGCLQYFKLPVCSCAIHFSTIAFMFCLYVLMYIITYISMIGRNCVFYKSKDRITVLNTY